MMASLRRHVLPVFVLVSLVSWVGCGSDPTSPPPEDAPGSLILTVPPLVVAGTPFPLGITARTSTGDLDPGVGGNVTLSVEGGSVTPSIVSLVAGVANPSITLDGVSGSVTVSAVMGSIEGQVTIGTVALGALPGAPTDPAAPAIPIFPYLVDLDGFATDHPDLAGLPLSFNQVLVSLTPGTSVSAVNAALAAVGASIVGGLPAAAGGHGLLVLRLPASGHAAAAAALVSLEQSPATAVVAPDVLLGETVVPRPSASPPPAWTWDPVPGTDNWGLEAIRAPVMWNANAAVEKKGIPLIRTAIIDGGFRATHPDLAGNVISVQATSEKNHGTHVAGTVGAIFDNGVGVDGVNRFARLHLIQYGADAAAAPNPLAELGSMGSSLINDLYTAATSGAAVVNMSMGYNWWNAGINIDANVDPAAQQLVAAHGQIVGDILQDLPATGVSVPMLVVAAGNDSDSFPNPIPSQFGSPMAFAGMNGLSPNVLVVAAVGSGGGFAPPVRAGFSNLPGHLSAPGVDIWSTYVTTPYGKIDGTSMAAPHVTGVIGYLLAVAPELTNAQLREIVLRDRIVTVGGAADMINAYWSLLNIDWARGDDRVLRSLLDIDDGSADGNLRLDANGTVVAGLDLDGDGGLGDGNIDMGDFRRWRDALLQLEDPAGLALNGAANHPKKDLNGDGVFGTPEQELAYPRGDFNGDGVLHRFATADVVGAIDGSLTDLEVLASRFSDPHYAVGELVDLIDTGDITVDARACLLAFGQAEYAESTVRTGAGQFVAARVHRLDGAVGEDVVQVYTVPAEDYEIEVNLYSDLDEVIATATLEATLPLGGDILFEPVCISSDPILVFQLQEWKSTHFDGASIDLGLFLGISQPDGSLLPAEGATFAIDVVQGASADAIGIVADDGAIWTSVQSFADENSPIVEVTIQATLEGFATTELTFSSDWVDWFVILNQHRSGLAVSAGASVGNFTPCENPDVKNFYADENTFVAFAQSATVSHSCADPSCGPDAMVAATGGASVSVSFEFYPDGGPKSIRVESSGTGMVDDYSSNGCFGRAGAGGGGWGGITFTVGSEVRTRLTGFVQHDGYRAFDGASAVYLSAAGFIWPGTVPGATNFDETDELSAGDYEFRVGGHSVWSTYTYSILYEFLPPFE